VVGRLELEGVALHHTNPRGVHTPPHPVVMYIGDPGKDGHQLPTLPDNVPGQGLVHRAGDHHLEDQQSVQGEGGKKAYRAVLTPPHQFKDLNLARSRYELALQELGLTGRHAEADEVGEDGVH
jgi:hypothetical protein